MKSSTRVPSVSVVIRAFNEEKHVGSLLEQIFDQDIGDPFEVVVVDSGSTDGTLEIVKKYPVKLVHIKPEEFSFGFSLNKGIKASKGEYLVFISAHCYPEYSHWLENLVAPFEDGKIGLVYGKQRGNELTKFSEHQIFFKLFPKESVHNQSTPFCNNANCAIRKSLWEKVPYDEELTGLEDLDWAKKILKMGYHLSYQANVGVIHIHEESWAKVFRRYEREAIALRRIFPETSSSLWDFLRIFSSNLVLDYARAFKNDRRIKSAWEIPVFRLMQFWGTYRGFNYKEPVTEELKKNFYYPKSVGDNNKKL